MYSRSKLTLSCSSLSIPYTFNSAPHVLLSPSRLLVPFLPSLTSSPTPALRYEAARGGSGSHDHREVSLVWFPF